MSIYLSPPTWLCKSNHFFLLDSREQYRYGTISNPGWKWATGIWCYRLYYSFQTTFKGTVHPKMKMLSSFIVVNLYTVVFLWNIFFVVTYSCICQSLEKTKTHHKSSPWLVCYIPCLLIHGLKSSDALSGWTSVTLNGIGSSCASCDQKHWHDTWGDVSKCKYLIWNWNSTSKDLFFVKYEKLTWWNKLIKIFTACNTGYLMAFWKN